MVVIYVVLLLLITGILILFFDVKRYEAAKMNKEKRGARFAGWLNICLGIILFIGYWVYEKWFWY